MMVIKIAVIMTNDKYDSEIFEIPFSDTVQLILTIGSTFSVG